MRYFLIPFFFCLLFSASFAQDEKRILDSLEAVLRNSSLHDTAHINARTEIGEVAGIMRVGYWDSIATDCDQLLQVTTDSLERKALLGNQAQCFNNIGFIYKRSGETIKGLDYYLRAHSAFLLLDDPRGLSTACNNLGLVYYSLGDIELALSYYNRALKIREETGDRHGMGNTYSNLGLLYQAQNDTIKSLEYYRKSLTVREEIDDQEGIAQSLNNIGTIYLDYGNYDSTMYYYRHSYATSESISDERGMSLALSNMANVYRLQGELDTALYYNYQTLAIRERINFLTGIANTTCKIGELYTYIGKPDSALKYAEWSMKVSEKLGYAEQIMNAAMILSQVYEKQGDGMKALSYFKMYIEHRDKINNEKTRAATSKQQLTYEYEKQKAIDDAAHLKELEVEQQRQAKQKIILAATIGGLILVLAFLVFIVNRLRLTRKQKAIIEQQKQVVENAHEQLEQKNREILDSINYAKRIQNAILPSQRIVQQSLPESFIMYRPKDIVAGDFYWMERKNNSLLFAVADCTGHGVPGALVSVICNNGLNRSVREFNLTDPGKVLEKTRDIVIGEFEKSDDDVKDGMDISLCSITGSTLQWAGANNGLWIIRGPELIEFKPNKQPIGKYSENRPFITHVFDLLKGDLLYMYSDGYADQFGGGKGKKFKASQLKEVLLSIRTESLGRQKQILEDRFDAWKGELEQLDDVCIWGMRFN